MVQAEANKSIAAIMEALTSKKLTSKFGLSAEVDQERMQLPLTKVSVKSELRGSNATTDVELTYVNPSTDNPLQCTYMFPIESKTVLASFEASFDDRKVVTKITSKESAQEKYEDAIAGGKGAVIAEKKKKDEALVVKLGNLLPGQKATIKQTILNQLEVVAGSFCFALPAAFFPDYKKIGLKGANALEYEFSYEVRICSDSRISNLSVPDGAETDRNDAGNEIVIRSN